MPQGAAPGLLAYDGSGLSQAAVRRTAEFFPDYRVVVATVWEPALRELPVVDPTGGGSLWSPADPETIEQMERAQHEQPRESRAKGPSWLAHSGWPQRRTRCPTR